MRALTASDRTSLIKLASELPKGDETRKAILAGLNKIGMDFSSKEEMKKYQKEHPKADMSKHQVVDSKKKPAGKTVNSPAETAKHTDTVIDGILRDSDSLDSDDRDMFTPGLKKKIQKSVDKLLLRMKKDGWSEEEIQDGFSGSEKSQPEPEFSEYADTLGEVHDKISEKKNSQY